MALSFFTDHPSISDNGIYLVPSKSVKYNNSPIINLSHLTSVKYYIENNSGDGTYICFQTIAKDEKWQYTQSDSMMNDYYKVVELLMGVKSNLSLS